MTVAVLHLLVVSQYWHWCRASILGRLKTANSLFLTCPIINSIVIVTFIFRIGLIRF